MSTGTDPKPTAEADPADAPDQGDGLCVSIVPRMSEISAPDWDACANPHGDAYNPFVSHAFLDLLEQSGSVAAQTGWRPCHVVMHDAAEQLIGCMPLYMKSHSRGEFVFDHAWADAYHRAGGRYYPKLVCAVPFTPVTGPRLMVNPGKEPADKLLLLAHAATEITSRLKASSLHINFTTGEGATELERQGFLHRTDQQFHFVNRGYRHFEDFLETLTSRKRKAIRKERRTALQNGISVRHLTGSDITEADWDAFYDFYLDTGDRKWGTPYLNREAFSLLGERLGKHCLLIMADREGRPIAGALNLLGSDCVYGRYWGAREHHSCLHFELCYYQAIDAAIERGLPRVEAGAQGEHKLARGYEPVTTHSAHWIADPGLRDAVARYLVNERAYIERAGEVLADYTPYRKNTE